MSSWNYLPNSCVFVNVYDVTNARKTQVGNKIVIDVILSRIKVWLHSVLLHPPLNISLRSTNPLRTLCRLITGVCLKKRKTINYHCKPWRMVQYLTTDCLCWDDRAWSLGKLVQPVSSSGQLWPAVGTVETLDTVPCIITRVHQPQSVAHSPAWETSSAPQFLTDFRNHRINTVLIMN